MKTNPWSNLVTLKHTFTFLIPSKEMQFTSKKDFLHL